VLWIQVRLFAVFVIADIMGTFQARYYFTFFAVANRNQDGYYCKTAGIMNTSQAYYCFRTFGVKDVTQVHYCFRTGDIIGASWACDISPAVLWVEVKCVTLSEIKCATI